MEKIAIVFLIFLLFTSGFGWIIHHSWWSPIIGLLIGLLLEGLFLFWLLRDIDIG